jgi:hypothetical protein
LSQLSRQVEARGVKRPQLADLRESGAIEQDADVVMFMWRENDEDFENMNLDIAKHRNGPLRSIKLRFRGDRIKFYSVEGKRERVNYQSGGMNLGTAIAMIPTARQVTKTSRNRISKNSGEEGAGFWPYFQGK